MYTYTVLQSGYILTTYSHVWDCIHVLTSTIITFQISVWFHPITAIFHICINIHFFSLWQIISCVIKFYTLLLTSSGNFVHRIEFYDIQLLVGATNLLSTGVTQAGVQQRPARWWCKTYTDTHTHTPTLAHLHTCSNTQNYLHPVQIHSFHINIGQGNAFFYFMSFFCCCIDMVDNF